MMGSGFDLSGLAPEDLQQLTIHAIQTSQECADAINQIGQALQMLMEKQSELSEHVDQLDDVLMKQLVGGIDELYQTNQHTQLIDGLKGQYGSMFEPHMDMLKDWYPDLDVYEKLGDEYNGMKTDMGDSFSEDAFGSRAKEIADAIAAKAAKYKGGTMAPDGAMVTSKEVSVAPAGPSAVATPSEGPDILAAVRRLKAQSNPSSLS